MDINIKTTLGINPRRKPKELLVITRGTSFLTTYNLDISYNIVSQVTFTFKQKQKLFYYNMFHYLVLTSDTEVEEGKKYYKNIVPINIKTSYECWAELVTNPVNNPQANGYYEEISSPSDDQNDFYYFIDDHFKYEKETNSVIFMYSPVETAKFSPTLPGAEIKFEVAVRANTDHSDDFVQHDTVYVDRQPSIIVKDSLYGQVLPGTNTVADDPD